MRIAVFGVGGAAGYFGGRLAQAGEEVLLVARGKHLQALRERGLRVESIKGDFAVDPIKATADPAGIGPVDAVLVGVKTWQVQEAAQAMRPMIGPDTFVVPLQNGVDAPAQLAAVLGAEHVVGGLCAIISMVAEPGLIRHVGADPYIQFGELDNRLSDRVEALRQSFSNSTGLTVEVPPDIQVAMWRKFLMIVSWSGVGAVTRAPLGVFLNVPETRQMLEGVMQEVFTLGRARGIALPNDAVEQTLTFMDNLPPTGTASMQRDIMQGRPSELESQNGAVVRMSEEMGIDAPLNKTIYQSLLPLELKARGRLQFADN